MTRVKFNVTLLIALFLILPQFIWAEEEKEKKEEGIRLEEVVVTATKTERKVTEVPASVTVITSEEIEAMQVTKTEDILRNVEGVDVQGFGGLFLGNVTLRSIPGSGFGATTLILIDGAPVEPMQIYRRFVWDIVTPEQIERIEIVRGPASALYGPNAMGGVINIITKKGKGKPSADVTTGYGSHKSYSIGASAGGSLDKFDFRISASQYETDGYKALPTRDPWGGIDLAGRDYKAKKFNTKLGYGITEDSEISIGLNYFDTKGAFSGGRPNSRHNREGNVINIDYKGRISSFMDLKAKVSRSDYNSNTPLDKDNYGTLGDYSLHSIGYEDEDVLLGEVQTDFHLIKGNTLTAGVSYSRGKWDFRRILATGTQLMGMRSKTEVKGVYLQDEHRFGDKVILTLGGRYDTFKFFDDERFSAGSYKPFAGSKDNVFNPRGGIRFNLSKDTSLYASAGTGYLPANNMYKYPTQTTILENPDLKPEKSISYEIGLDQKIGDFMKGKMALYKTDYKDKITLVTVGATRQYQNVDKMEFKGVEAGLEAIIGTYWLPFVNYTYSDAEITKNTSNPALEGKRPTFTPLHKINVGMTYDNPRYFNARVAGRYVGDRYRDSQNTDKVGDYVVMDAKISKRITINRFMKDIDLSFAVNNIFDRKYTEFSYELQDGRNFWVEVGMRF